MSDAQIIGGIHQFFAIIFGNNWTHFQSGSMIPEFKQGNEMAFTNRVKIRDTELRDIPIFMDYWYRSPESFIRSMGVDPTKMKPEIEQAAYLRESILSNLKIPNSKLPFLTIELDGRAVGSHSLGDVVEGESGVFHAHLWFKEVRGIGLCTYTYPLASKVFMDRFGLKEIYFKTPSLNVGANKIKQGLGLQSCGEEPITYFFMLPGLTAKIYRLSRMQLDKLL